MTNNLPRNNSPARDAHWLPLGRVYSREVPVSARNWILDQGSLTRRLLDISAGEFQVNVLHQGMGRPTASEQQRLGMRSRETALIREVQLLCHGQPWVFARSIIPQSTLLGKNRALLTLGNKPLGALLFSSPGTRRTIVEVARFPESSIPFKLDPPGESWGRRSLFYLNGKPLLVGEIFLPRALHYFAGRA